MQLLPAQLKVGDAAPYGPPHAKDLDTPHQPPKAMEWAETIAEAAALARKGDGANPLGNTDFAPQWRGKMIEKYVDAVLREVAGLPVERLVPHHG